MKYQLKKNENWKDSYKNYILFVNTLLPYKNIMTFLNAFYLIKDKIKQNIIIVGKTTEYWTNEVIPFLEQKGLLHRVVHLENISNAELVKLYQDASLFVTTSLKEGFGYTPIEAAMCGCPVISSKCEALLDTTKDLLFYYEPAQDAGELSKQICYVINNPPSKKKLDDIAYKYREIYSPQKQYRNFKQIFNSL
ncbi:glycosyltransferase [Prevotella jejuni]|uniref:glycosyltransferase n=1 Tax=Prevotella jejuni TaxID=1177574 RepID=UPI0013053B12|nr:glycosyltransferase [Prevotella jejuni]